MQYLLPQNELLVFSSQSPTTFPHVPPPTRDTRLRVVPPVDPSVAVSTVTFTEASEALGPDTMYVVPRLDPP